jgi:hypothetical protein
MLNFLYLVRNFLFLVILLIILFIIAWLLYNPPAWLESIILSQHLDKSGTLQITNYSRSNSPLATWVQYIRNYSEQLENAIWKVNKEKEEEKKDNLI